MAQILLPNQDLSTGSWSATPLWSKVDDDSSVNASGDGTTIASDDNTSPDTASFSLTAGTDPTSSSGHILRVRWHKNAAGGHQINPVLELWQDGGASAIATFSVADIGATEVESTYTLSAGEADAITDYSTLQLVVSRQGDTGGNPNGRRSLVVDLVEFEVPDAGAVVEQVSGSLAVTISLSGTPSVPVASVPQVAGGTSVLVSLSGTPSVPAASVEQISGSKAVSVALAGTSSVPASSIPQVGGDKAVALSLSGTPSVPVASIPQISGSRAVSVTLAGTVALPSTTPEVGGTKSVSITTSGTAQVPAATISQISGSFTVIASFAGIINVPTATVPQISGGKSVSIVLAGFVTLPGEVTVDPFEALRPSQVNMLGPW